MTRKPIRGIVSAFCMLCVTAISVKAETEPFTYHENFESRSLNAWVSYPLWQDTAYDDNFTVGEMIPGDANLSITQFVTAYEPGDCHAGAQKKLDFFLTPGFRMEARYYLKSHLPVRSMTIKIAAGSLGALDVMIPSPPVNRWERLTVTFNDIVAANPAISGMGSVRAYGIAFLAAVEHADPSMPLWFGLDDIVIRARRTPEFRFITPATVKYAEWKEHISLYPLRRGDKLSLRGDWPLRADRVRMAVSPLSNGTSVLMDIPLRNAGGLWVLDGVPLNFGKGIYRGVLTAFRDTTVVGTTEFTFTMLPEKTGGVHPRLWFDKSGRDTIRKKLGEERYAGIGREIATESARMRTAFPVERMIYDFDQFPDENWLVTRYSWSFDRIRSVGEAVYWNALAWSLLGDRTAGDYAKKALLAYSGFPTWNHPWMKKNGRPFYLLTGDMAMYFALGYDLVYDTMNESERLQIRAAFIRNVIHPVHKGYFEANMVTTHTSNWIAAIMGGSLLCQAAIHGDGPDAENPEPYLTGAVLKDYALISHATGSDGGYGEGYNYFHYSSQSWSKSLPALESVFGVDISARLNGAYDELVWAGRPTEKEIFYFGDSRGVLQPMEAWAWLIPKYKDPLLAWMYRLSNTDNGKLRETKRVSGFDTFSASGTSFFSVMQGLNLKDLIYDTEKTVPGNPFKKPPVRLFRDIGTTVFRGGWKPDDFVFVMRTGPFYNHQHLDQGTFWLADRGSVFIGERQGSAYYDDPLYESNYTKPVAHSTILVNGKSQSQRTGDPKDYIPGFDDHADATLFLDGAFASFVSGDIGRLYKGAVQSLKRSVLFLKPRTVILLDTAVPTDNDADISLLFQADRLGDILPGTSRSSITKNGTALHLMHLAPKAILAEAVETPHYLSRLRAAGVLEKEGMLRITARTRGVPLVMANLLATSPIEEKPDMVCAHSDGFLAGKTAGIDFAISTSPGTTFRTAAFETDAEAILWKGETVFAAACTKLIRNGRLIVKSRVPMVCEMDGAFVKYYSVKGDDVTFGVPKVPALVTVNGLTVTPSAVDAPGKTVTIHLPAGECSISFK